VIPDEARALARVTPLVRGAGAWLKLESLQATGSFKLRGAAVKLARLGAAVRARGVVAASAGNHGLGMALAARRFGVPLTVVVPESAARVKVDGIARLGADVVRAGAGYVEAEVRAQALAVERGVPFVSPFDDDDVIEGNGAWLGEELYAQRAVARVIVPVGGGGLIAGLARALQPRGVEVIGVQPRANCAMHDSFVGGAALTAYAGGATVCDGLEGAVAARTYEIARAYVRRVVLVDEDEVLAAMAYAYRELGLIVEPSAAVGIAAVRGGHAPADDATAIVVTGANVDAELLDRALAAR
jgi:threonine dehydratase